MTMTRRGVVVPAVIGLVAHVSVMMPATHSNAGPVGSASQEAGAAAAESTGTGTALSARPEAFQNCIKYLGGPGFPDFRGHESWNNSFTLTGSEGICSFGSDTLAPVNFALSGVTSILYGQASSRHVGVWLSVGVIVAPIALLGLLHKSRKHTVLISWKSRDGREGGVYFEVQPDHYRRLLNSLSFQTGKPIYADEKDREWLRTQGVEAMLDPETKTQSKSE
jgi:hypothetical protein